MLPKKARVSVRHEAAFTRPCVSIAGQTMREARSAEHLSAVDVGRRASVRLMLAVSMGNYSCPFFSHLSVAISPPDLTGGLMTYQCITVS